MTKESLSRRRFLRNVSAGSAGAALMTAVASEAATEVPYPLTVESYPLSAPSQGVTIDRLKILTREGLSAADQEKIRGVSRGIDLTVFSSGAGFSSRVAEAQVIYGQFSREDLKAARELRWIQYTAAGVERILHPELVESPVVLTNMQRVYAPSISETAIGLLIALAHGINRYSVQTRDRQWKPLDGFRDVSGMTMGIVGLGGIGSEIARRAHFGFGINVLAVDPKPLPRPEFVAELHPVEWLPQMAPQVDVLVSAAPHTPQSENMFNESVFRAMKRDAYFINMSRGKLVDTPALVRALKEGWIAGAGLDVAYKEPLPSDEPLWTAGNVIITCHTSGRTPRSDAGRIALLTENLQRYMNGLPLLNVVDKKRGY
ncbi:MAG: D-2-hydroxyacid dehydrogenase [Acidobacteria bacterium]|nr:D-2-hydroxyacid dehydrogenase [Acidobacteriota bacterium]